MITRELLQKVRRIEIRTAHVVDEMLSGRYHSAFRGRGVEFEEVRLYQPGDDIRSIDWNVTARYNEPYVKLFREERELTVVLLTDISASESIGTAGQLKRELVSEVGATLALSAIRNNDKVGLIAFTDDIEKVVPARKGTRHVLRLIRELLYCQPIGSGTNIARALEHLNKTHKRRSVVFLISDFQDAGYEKALRLARGKHDSTPIGITARRELELPNVGLVELWDAETKRTVLVDTASKKNRCDYARRAGEALDARKRMFDKLKIDSVNLITSEDFVEPLRKFFHKRQVRMKR